MVGRATVLSASMDQVIECHICNSCVEITFLVREVDTFQQNLIMGDQDSATQITRGDLTLAVCADCGFIFNQTFDPSRLRYGASYDNTQSHSPFFEEYLDDLVRYLIFDKNVRDCRVVEVGCGKGSFLRKLVMFEDSGNSGHGFDQSYDGPETGFNGLLRFERRCYGPDCDDKPTDVVVCRHVIEHVSNTLDMLRTIRRGLVNSPRARLFFETSWVLWILSTGVL